MKTRIITAIVGILVLIGVMFTFNTMVFNLVIAAITLIAIHEIYSALGFEKKDWLMYAVLVPYTLLVMLSSYSAMRKLVMPMSFVLVTCFFIYYLIYIFVPVAGPQFYFPAIGMDSVSQGVFPSIGDYFNHNQELLPGPGYQHGFFYSLVEGSQQVGERPTAAFPSSHVGVSTILMIMAWRASKKLFACLMPFYLLLCGATVYIQAHYLIDAIAGFVSAFVLYVLVTKMFKKWFAVPMFK